MISLSGYITIGGLPTDVSNFIGYDNRIKINGLYDSAVNVAKSGKPVLQKITFNGGRVYSSITATEFSGDEGDNVSLLAQIGVYSVSLTITPYDELYVTVTTLGSAG